jgi:hypothetical protein
MKSRILIAALLCLSVVACGSETAANKPEIANAPPSNSTNANTYVAINPPTNSANAFSPNSNTRATSPGPTANAKPLTYAAPDNSQFAVAMGGSGFPIETRTFTSDKYIAKVVRSWQDPTKKTISIHLKSGKVVSVAGDKWPDIKSQPVSAFYEAAGIKITQNPAAEPKRKTEQPQ